MMTGISTPSNWQIEYLKTHARIRAARKFKGLTQAEAGDLIGICERTYRDFEAGRTDIQSARLFRLAEVLNLRITLTHGAHYGIG